VRTGRPDAVYACLMGITHLTPLAETARHALAAAVLGLTVTGVVPVPLGVALAALASGSAVAQMVRRQRDLAHRRASADALLAAVPGTRVPERLRWRASELTAPEHRREVAHQLERLSRMAGQPFLLTSIPVFPSTLRPNRSGLASVAEIVGHVERPVTPRGMLLLETLLGDAGPSPLYRPRHAAELERVLLRVRQVIEP
jgi:hypothetical protein